MFYCDRCGHQLRVWTYKVPIYASLRFCRTCALQIFVQVDLAPDYSYAFRFLRRERVEQLDLVHSPSITLSQLRDIFSGDSYQSVHIGKFHWKGGD